MKQKSFTLIELLVVIAIIGLLSSVVLVSMQGAREKARESKMSETLRQIDLAANLDYQKYENWSSDIGPNQCDPCYATVARPRFVNENIFPLAGWDDAKWYCPQCCYDWQLWGGDWVSIDVYKCKTDGSCCDVVRRRCIGTNPTCASF